MSTPNCYVDCWDKDDKTGRKIRFSGPQDYPNLDHYNWDDSSGKVTDDIASLQTGSQGWVIAYSQKNYEGKTKIYNHNTTVAPLSSDMKNTIASLQVYDSKPVDPNNVVDNFLDLYSNTDTVNKDQGTAIEFYAQDAHYRIYYPTIAQTTAQVAFTVNLDHIISAGVDDHAVIEFVMDHSGKFLQQITVTYDMNTGAYQVPKWVLKFVDKGIDLAADEAIACLDGAEVVLTMGLGTELVIPTDILILAGAELLTIGVNHVNAVIGKLFRLSEDGGTMYFSAVVAHAAARLVYAYYQELYGQDSGPLLTFSESSFLSCFKKSSWDTSKNTKFIEFDYHDSSYRCYHQDHTAGYAKAGYISSLKLDAINDHDKDDHLILLVTFDPTGKLFSVQASIDIFDAPEDSDDQDKYVAPSSGTIAYNKDGKVVQITDDDVIVLSQYTQVEDAYSILMQTAFNNTKYVDKSDFSDALNHLIGASCKVLEALKSAIQA